MRRMLSVLAAALAVITPTRSQAAWCKVQLHAHSYWSDGNDAPEAVLEQYRLLGFTAVVMSEHGLGAMRADDSFLTDDYCKTRPYNDGGGSATRTRWNALLPDRVDYDASCDGGALRIYSFANTKAFMEGPRDGGAFFLIPGEELTASDQHDYAIHVHAIAISAAKFGTGDGSVSMFGVDDAGNADAIAGKLTALIRDAGVSAEAGISKPLAQLNHPNWKHSIGWPDWYLLDLQMVEILSAFSIPGTAPSNKSMDFGDSSVQSMRVQWDRANWERWKVGLPLIWGTATDDAHHYVGSDGSGIMGRAWINVLCDSSPTESELINSIEDGDFYSTGYGGIVLTTLTQAGGCVSVTSPGSTDRIKVIGINRSDGQWYISSDTRGSVSNHCPDAARAAFYRIKVWTPAGAVLYTNPVAVSSP